MVEGSADGLYIGNTQLLEAIDARAQVLQDRGRPKGKAAEQLHWWLPSSELSCRMKRRIEHANTKVTGTQLNVIIAA